VLLSTTCYSQGIASEEQINLYTLVSSLNQLAPSDHCTGTNISTTGMSGAMDAWANWRHVYRLHDEGGVDVHVSTASANRRIVIDQLAVDVACSYGSHKLRYDPFKISFCFHFLIGKSVCIAS